MTEMKIALSIEEAADYTGIGRNTLRDLVKWGEAYGEKATPKAETMHEKKQRYREKVDRQNASQPYRGRDKGAR